MNQFFNLRDMVVVENIEFYVSSFTEDSFRFIIFSKWKAVLKQTYTSSIFLQRFNEPKKIFEQSGRDEDGALLEVDDLILVQLVSQFPHGTSVRRPAKDSNGRRTVFE